MPDPAELLVTEFITVKQRCTAVSVRFDDQAVADYFEDMVDRGLKPDQSARCWLHTHPGDSAEPSGLDEETFERVFGRCDWAILFIAARGGASYARLRFNTGPGGELLLPVGVRWDLPLDAVDPDAWRAEYEANVVEELASVSTRICEWGQQVEGFGELEVERPIDDPADAHGACDFDFNNREIDDEPWF